MRELRATREAFAALLGDGTVVTWGDAAHGGDSSSVQAQLKDVQELHAAASVFYAILANGSIVVWGGPADGAQAVQELLMC